MNDFSSRALDEDSAELGCSKLNRNPGSGLACERRPGSAILGALQSAIQQLASKLWVHIFAVSGELTE
jgi:hypothetical protein